MVTYVGLAVILLAIAILVTRPYDRSLDITRHWVGLVVLFFPLALVLGSIVFVLPLTDQVVDQLFGPRQHANPWGLGRLGAFVIVSGVMGSLSALFLVLWIGRRVKAAQQGLTRIVPGAARGSNPWLR